MARHNSFVATPSILEYLTLKQIYLYGKTIITHGLHTDRTKLYYDFIFWAIGVNIIKYDVTIVLALSRISALIDLNFGNALRCAYFGCSSSGMRRFSEIYERNLEISWNFFKKGIDYA